MLRLTATIVLTAVVGLNPTTGPLTGSGAGDAAVVYRETLPGVAWVVTAKPCAGHIRACEGTAWVADAKNRLLVTNHHVTAGAKAIRVYFPAANDRGTVATCRDWYESHGPGVAGRVVAADPKTDLAVIQVDGLPDGVKELKLAGGSVAPGELAHTIGNAGSDQALWGYANGTVRAVYQMASRDGTFAGRVIESSVPAGPGSSGSPVLNAAGEVIGVVFANKRNARRVTLSVDAAEVRVVLASAQAMAKVNGDGPGTLPR
jgi:S1-C subfamily serine protease